MFLNLSFLLLLLDLLSPKLSHSPKLSLSPRLSLERYWQGQRFLKVGEEGNYLMLHCRHQNDFCIKTILIFPLLWKTWQQEASDGVSWRSSVRKASCEFEAERHKAAKETRRMQKERATSLPFSSQTFVCPKYSRGCASRIGFYSSQRACKN